MNIIIKHEGGLEKGKSEMIEIIQSWILTTSRYDFSVYEKRITYKIVEMTQHMLKGLKLNRRYRIDKDLFDMYEVEIPVSELLIGEDDKNHEQIKKALRSMAKKLIEYEDGEKWRATQLIIAPEIGKYSSTVKFKLHEDVYNALLDFSKGYKKYELNTVFEFESVYAMRFYELFSNQRTPLTFSIQELKLMFGLEKKYKKIDNFIRRVVEQAKDVLDRKSTYSFEYTTIKKGRKIVCIKFYPKQIRENVTEEYKSLMTEKVKKQIEPFLMLERHILNYLKEHYMFSTPELKNNISLFEQAQKKIPDLLMFLSEVKAKANRAANPKGYLINALKKHLKSNEEEMTSTIEKKRYTRKQQQPKSMGALFAELE